MYLSRRSFLVGLAAVGLVTSGDSVASADAVSDALADIGKSRAGLKTMVASFTQERQIGLLATAVKSEGELTLVRPDRLRWELKPPDAITYWVTPEGLAMSTGASASAVGK